MALPLTPTYLGILFFDSFPNGRQTPNLTPFTCDPNRA